MQLFSGADADLWGWAPSFFLEVHGTPPGSRFAVRDIVPARVPLDPNILGVYFGSCLAADAPSEHNAVARIARADDVLTPADFQRHLVLP